MNSLLKAVLFIPKMLQIVYIIPLLCFGTLIRALSGLVQATDPNAQLIIYIPEKKIPLTFSFIM